MNTTITIRRSKSTDHVLFFFFGAYFFSIYFRAGNWGGCKVGEPRLSIVISFTVSLLVTALIPGFQVNSILIILPVQVLIVSYRVKVTESRSLELYQLTLTLHSRAVRSYHI